MTRPEPPTHDFRSELSLKPLLDFWRNQVASNCRHMADLFTVFERQIVEHPELKGEIKDFAVIEKHRSLITPLMSVAFSPSGWETAIMGAMTPLDHRPFYYTPQFRRVLMTEDGRVKGNLKQPEQDTGLFLRLRAFWLILDKIYGISHGRNIPVVRTVVDPETGLERHYRILPDWQFLEVETLGPAPPLGTAERRRVVNHIDDPEQLARIIAPQRFLFRGFTIIRAVDVTESEVFLDLEKDLIGPETMFCSVGFSRLQHRMRTLLGRPGLSAGLGALQGDQVWVVRDNDPGGANCIFKNSNHIPASDLKGSIWLRALEQEDMLIVPDLADENSLCAAEKELLDSGARSVLVVPLFYQKQIIGTFFVVSPDPHAFTAMDKMLIRPVIPMFAMAIKRGVDDINNEVQAIIKEKCTALHPSVEWRFRKAAFGQLERLHMGETTEMEPIVFRDVIPLFGQTDIRGSADARAASIQADLIEQLNLARDVLRRASRIKPWPLVLELQHRMEARIEQLSHTMQAGEEAANGNFLSREVEPAFEELAHLGSDVAQSIRTYREAVDPRRGFVYRKREAYERSVAMLNERLSTYLDQQEAEAQKAFPHYFEKHQTDGLDYVIYLGAALREDGRFNPFHLQNMVLWQLVLACGMAWHTEQVKSELAIPMDTCHLILYNPSPLSIRFRYDEKRFDVDGAYDVRYEIIKSRLDKAMLKGGKQRLTHPGRIAVVYSQPQELRDMRKHINYLQQRGHLLEDTEMLELEDLPSVRGLKALRVGVNVQSPPLQWIDPSAAG